MVSFNKSDLQFILDQIIISERHAAGESLLDILPNALVPHGLRTISGELNNLANPELGAADNVFPRMTTPVFNSAEGGTSYAQLTGPVIDSQPRIVSNLIVDQTTDNPAAVAAAAANDGAGIVTSPGRDGVFGTADDVVDSLFIPNVTPDAGLTAPFNSWMTFFGQFFDHGLDLVTKSKSEVIFIPLAADDPLLTGPNPPAAPFMIVSRAQNQAGPDKILGTADDVREHTNTTSPFVDQNQTYSSHPSHQVFLRAYALDAAGRPIDTGKLITNRDLGADGRFGGAGANADTDLGGMATWKVVKAQARDLLGINLTDADVGNVPLLATDAYGNFLRDANGMPQVVVRIGNGSDGIAGTSDDVTTLVPGNRAAPLDLSNPIPGNPSAVVVRTGHAFLDDIAHAANPRDSAGALLTADADSVVNTGAPPPAGEYDNELLDAHYIAGDGRVNENIGLTAVHSVFHSEHNRLVEHTKQVLIADAQAMLATGSTQAQAIAFLNAWLRVDVATVPATPAEVAALQWDGQRLFQAAKFGTEMQYQHLVFEEFARTIQPNVDAFLAPNGYDVTIDPSIVAEFAHTVYRFGHSMLTETVDRYDANFDVIDQNNNVVAGGQQMGLIKAFLNPLAFAASGVTAEQATGAIVRGVTRQVGNEIDEFVTEALRNNLVGLPLDLAAINIARGRDTGIPSLNEARRQFFEATGDNQLKPYASWVEFMDHLKHPESLINFIAAYGTHSSITGAATLADKRAAATLLVLGGAGEPLDRLDFLHARGTWAAVETGLNNVDFWIGGLAEEQMPFGGLLGSTFNFVFETQLEALQDADRFYYLSRTAGLNFGTELEQNSFAKLVMANSDATHLPANIFQTPAFTLEVDASRQFTGLGVDGRADPTGGTSINGVEVSGLVQRAANYLKYTGEDHVVLGGTAGNDTIISSIGDDTIYGDGGNDRLEGGYGNDTISGGAGDDIIQDAGGDDKLDGGEGNDVIQAGNNGAGFGGNLVFGGEGNDFIINREDVNVTFGGKGNDFILGAKTDAFPTGNEGDDWIEWGTQDGAPGDNFAPLGTDNVTGNDIFVGGGGFDELLGEGGDDIFVGSDAEDRMDGDSGYDWVTYKNDRIGVTADLSFILLAQPHGNTPNANAGVFNPVAGSSTGIADRFQFVEGVSGSRFGDILKGDDADAAAIAGGAVGGNVMTNPGLIAGLPQLLARAGLTSVNGNTILGGSGSDLIEGRGGDDLIDGDSWLNVRISVRAGVDPATGNPVGAEIGTADGMAATVTSTNPALNGKTLVELMLAGLLNPGQLQAVREIRDDDNGYDTAVLTGPRAQYTITTVNGVTVVSHDRVVDPVTGAFTVGVDGTDRLVNVERLLFEGETNPALRFVNLSGTNNNPTGALAINDTTPTVGQTLAVTIGNVSDINNGAAGAAGFANRFVSYTWQVERVANSGIFEDIRVDVGGAGVIAADGSSFRVTADLAGLRLRTKGIYQDGAGNTEIVFSAPTGTVAAGAVVPPTALAPIPEVTSTGPGVFLASSDLSFILDQIKIAEGHAAGQNLMSLVTNARTAQGLRTVDGSFNNLTNQNGINQTEFGAADNVFPRVTTPTFKPAEGGTSYTQTSGTVVDSQPRTISNLLVDQTANNQAVYAAAMDPGLDGVLNFGIPIGTPGNDDVLKPGVEIVKSPGLDGLFGTADDKDVFLLPNVSPDEGLSAPFNQWMTFFGQFFDHGLDLVTKGGSGTVFIPLQPDDPLFRPGSPTNFMVVTRATNQPGPDGVLGTTDDIHEHTNTTSPFVDQNQTYSSHPSHQVFLRAYTLDALGRPVDTGKLLTNRDLGADGRFGGTGANADTDLGGMATWKVVKAQARDLLGINLTDADVNNIPLLATDAYGNFLLAANGMPQVVVRIGNGADGIAGTADDVTRLVAGNRAAPINLQAPPGGGTVVRTGHAFLDDIAHTANPRSSTGALLTADADTVVNTGAPPAAGQYDNELLDAHYIAGDGRVNENIGLTAVHNIFHSEHNRLVEQIKGTVLSSGNLAFLNEWLRVDLPANTTFPLTTAQINALQWDGKRLFQAAKFGTEMQYQHLVFEEFARTIQPNVDLFFAPTQVYDVDLDASIVAEFAHTVYRFGHSMLNETVDRFDVNFDSISVDPMRGVTNANSDQQMGLIAAFLNPLAFAASGVTAEQATGAIVRGVTRQVGNEIDEFVTEALRNNLVGLPLDLAAINIARGRDTGVPSLNEVRRQVYAQTGDSNLKPYLSWADLVDHLKHPESLINFIAAYGTHSTITSAASLAAKRAAAVAIVLGGGGAPGDRLDFLNGTGAWANTASGVTTTGVDAIDLWIGGLAEKKMPFGGMLGSTFNFIFENQLEKLQDGDRFYYLERTAGLAFNAELEGNSFAKLIMANSDVTHLPALVFTTPTFTLEVDQTKQHTGLGLDGRADPTGDNPLLPLVLRDDPHTPAVETNYLKYTGEDHVVLGGTAGNDTIISGAGDDSVYGDAGNDRLEGGYGNDTILGGVGNDIITDIGGDDVIQGGDGHDVIHGGNGVNLIIGGAGSDFIVTGEDASESIGGMGNDFILGTKGDEQNMGNEGDDWIEFGTSDGAPGDSFDPLGLDRITGNDVFIGSGELDKFNAEGGDDIMLDVTGLGSRFIGASGYDWAVFRDDPNGVNIDMSNIFLDTPRVPGDALPLLRFDFVEGLSGSHSSDVLKGDNSDAASLRLAGAQGSVLTNFALISDLEALVGTAATTVNGVKFFDGGNIILGGGGSDHIEGRGGNDVIDGDAWLNVRISVRDRNNPNIELKSANSMTELVNDMLAGTYTPDQLRIVREIRTATGPDFDTAVYSGVRADYTVTFNPNGTVTVSDSRGLDGTDTLRNIERIQFADQALLVPGTGGSNNAPVGTFSISGTPLENQLLTVSLAGITDADNPGGVITGPVAYFWQADTGSGGRFVDITAVNGVGVERAHGTSFRPTNNEVGNQLRVRAVYTDAAGHMEEVFSAPTAVIANINQAPVGTVAISDLTPTEGQALLATPSITDADGLVGVVFNFQWQRANATGVGGGAAGFTAIPGATAATYTPVQADVNRELRVVVTYTDNQGTLETVISAATTVTGDNFVGLPPAFIPTEGQDNVVGTIFNETFNGLGEADTLTGGAGSDTLNGGAGNDTLAGGTNIAGLDVVNGDAGDDIINYTFGDGNDAINGGADTDTLNIRGTNSVVTTDTLSVNFNGTAITAFAAGTATGNTVANVERVTLDLLAGNDSLSYGLTTNPLVGVTVNLAAGTASGFATIAGVENVRGGAGNDAITGDGNANRLNGDGGNDTLAGGGGNDTILGGLGDDTINYVFGDGVDSINGEGGTLDTLNIRGTGSATATDTLSVAFNGTAITGFAAGTATGNTVAGVERVTLDLLAGEDSLSYGQTTVAVTVNLATSTASGFVSVAGVENLRGGSAGDSLTGDGNANRINGDAGNDTLVGGGGSDILIGGTGRDSMTGGAGDDTFDFNAAAESAPNPATANDLITDFEGAGVVGGDVIDLFDIDAIGNQAGNQAFSFVGTGPFTGLGQLRYVQDVAANQTIIEGNIVGGAAPEFRIRLSGLHTLSAGDFTL